MHVRSVLRVLKKWADLDEAETTQGGRGQAGWVTLSVRSFQGLNGSLYAPLVSSQDREASEDQRPRSPDRNHPLSNTSSSFCILASDESRRVSTASPGIQGQAAVD